MAGLMSIVKYQNFARPFSHCLGSYSHFSAPKQSSLGCWFWQFGSLFIFDHYVEGGWPLAPFCSAKFKRLGPLDICYIFSNTHID